MKEPIKAKENRFPHITIHYCDVFTKSFPHPNNILILFFFVNILILLPVIVFAEPPTYSYKIKKTYPHNQLNFTQGLVFTDGFLYESTGRYGKSSLFKTHLETGNTIQRPLPSSYFGEGITIFGDRIIQLTLKGQIGFIYEKSNLHHIGSFKYSTEGWGITHDGTQIIMSDGSSSLYFLNPFSFSITKKIEITDQYGPVKLLNELEYIKGEIYANIWRTERIARINPITGKVTGWLNLQGLKKRSGVTKEDQVLNGIAYDAENDRLFVTGKRWPYIYEITPTP